MRAVDLYVIRHAAAEPRGPGVIDSERRLTAEGRARFTAVVARLARAGVQLDGVLHSPWARATETAALVRPLCAGVFVSTELLARRPTKALLREIGGATPALVGHEPWLSELVGWLVMGTRSGKSFELKKGAVAWLRGTPKPGGMTLRALVGPEWLA